MGLIYPSVRAGLLIFVATANISRKTRPYSQITNDKRAGLLIFVATANISRKTRPYSQITNDPSTSLRAPQLTTNN
ncbi:MAG: hypothetical protein EAZ18_08305 [Oscillatoriales cyanobacterium]|nr:MAG: hypothetical protein EAZ18_08305 [Oscillatoriales cyanobacterium]